MKETGKLYLVPTPIGNLGDMTFRAVEVLKSVDLILAEDTRTSGKLLQHYDIGTPAQSFHLHNEHKKTDEVIEKLKTGINIAQISDAGTPGISDPGYLLVRAALENEIEVEVLPGATALVLAVVQSGIPCERFTFEGFLPHKKGRQTRINALKEETRTAVFYESPHRLIKTLTQMRELLGERNISVSRELTKKFEETVRGNFTEVIAHFENHSIKGEFVLVIGGVEK